MNAIEVKLFQLYRELTYKKLTQGLEAIRSRVTKVEPAHIHELLKRCQEWLKGEVAKQVDPEGVKLIIENAANQAVQIFCKNNHIRLEAPKGEGTIAAIENLMKDVTVRQFPPKG